MVDITLPGRRADQQAVRTQVPKSPGVGGVPTVPPPSDSGLRREFAAPGSSGEALFAAVEDVGGAVAGAASEFAAQMVKAEARVRTREDTVERARDELTYKELARKEKVRVSAEEDFSEKGVAQGYGIFLESEKQRLLSEHTGSPDSLAALDIQLSKIQGKFADEAALETAVGQRKLIDTAIELNTRELTAEVLADPGSLSEKVQEVDDLVANFADHLTPEEEIDHLVDIREQLALAALQSWLNRGMIGEAQRVFNETPGLVSMLSPENIRALDAKFKQFEKAAGDARAEGLAVITKAETIIGSKTTPEQRLRLAKLQPTAGERTMADDIAEAEFILERPLNDEETRRAVMQSLGIDDGFQTDAGKQVSDRQKVINLYGEGSDQLAAFDALSEDTGDVPLGDTSTMRNQFSSLSSQYRERRAAFSAVAASSRQSELPGEQGGAGDVALIISFMKMIEPDSVVRESEFRTIAETGSAPQRVLGAINLILKGQRLTEEIRSDFVERAEFLMEGANSMQLNLEREYKRIAEGSGIDPALVVVDFMDVLRPEGTDLPKPTARKPKRIDVDLQGNIVGSE